MDRPRGKPQEQINVAVDALTRLVPGEHCVTSLCCLHQLLMPATRFASWAMNYDELL
jgi:hypothetical protein